MHRSVLAIFDSPLAKAGLSEVLIHTTDKKVIRLDKSMRVAASEKIPRTEKRFNGLLAQVLDEGEVRPEGSAVALMKLLPGQLEEHLPADAAKVGRGEQVGTSSAARFVSLREYVGKASAARRVVFVVGAVSKGQPCSFC